MRLLFCIPINFSVFGNIWLKKAPSLLKSWELWCLKLLACFLLHLGLEYELAKLYRSVNF